MLAHSGHQGIVKTKRFLRDSVWFPGIDSMVEEAVKGCLPCQAANHDQSQYVSLYTCPPTTGPVTRALRGLLWLLSKWRLLASCD